MQAHDASAHEVPGTHRVVFGDAETSMSLRLDGWVLRDTFLVMLPRAQTILALLVRRPLEAPTVAERVLRTGTGGLNIGACRVGVGRWPPNVILVHSTECGDSCASDCPVYLLDAQSGFLVSGRVKPEYARHSNENWSGGWQEDYPLSGYGDAGGASRFFPAFRTLEGARRWLEALVGSQGAPASDSTVSLAPEVTTPNPPSGHAVATVDGYATELGAMVCGDSKDLLAHLADDSVDLVLTSPPYALEFKKEYGNVDKAAYVGWFRPFADQIYRALKPTGSCVINIGGSYNAGTPTRSLYHFRLLIELCDQVGFHLAQECFWYNPAKLPAPAEWVNVRRMRIKDSVEYVFWLSKTAFPKADNRRVLEPYSNDMKRLIVRGGRAKERPSGHKISAKFVDRGGSIPPNLIVRGNNESNSSYMRGCERSGMMPHPARFPAALPEFFIELLTERGDLVVDPFAGSNTTGAVAESLQRRWLSFERERRYVEGSKVRFDLAPSGH